MKWSKFNEFLKDNFVLGTCLLSVLLAGLYALKGIQEEFFTGTWIVIGLNLLYVPCAIIFKRKCFSFFYLIYALILTFVLAFEKSFLFNNFTALFILFIVIMTNPKWELLCFVLYLVATSIAFLMNDESLVHFFIHLVRSLWFIQIFTVTLNFRYKHKKLILFDDEKEILSQLCNGKVYQKEVEGFSENTIYRKLKAARERNGNVTREQLIKLYRKELDAENDF